MNWTHSTIAAEREVIVARTSYFHSFMLRRVSVAPIALVSLDTIECTDKKTILVLIDHEESVPHLDEVCVINGKNALYFDPYSSGWRFWF